MKTNEESGMLEVLQLANLACARADLFQARLEVSTQQRDLLLLALRGIAAALNGGIVTEPSPSQARQLANMALKDFEEVEAEVTQ